MVFKTRNVSAAIIVATLLAAMLAMAGVAYAATSNGSRVLSTTQSGKDVQGTVSTASEVAVYRLYNPKTGEHHYTTDANEKKVLKGSWGWNYEGVGWFAPTEGTKGAKPVYRLFDPKTEEHLYTTDANEKKVLSSKARGWNYEGIAWYSGGTVSVTRLYNKSAKKLASHHYTLDAHEVDVLVSSKVWKKEGVAWKAQRLGYQVKDGWIKQAGKWRWYNEDKLVKDSWVNTIKSPFTLPTKSKQRYRVDAKGNLVTGFFKVDGSSYYGIPKKGYILRGKMNYDSDTKLVADKKTGKLPTKTGFVWTTAYDGSKQRYYFHAVDSKNKGYYGARMGRFTVAKKSYFGRYDQGYLVRGTYYSSGVYHRANDNGVLQSGATMSGIDISSWQAGIDVTRVDADFIIVKATQGNWYTNPYFKTWARQILASGKKLGIYHFADGGPSAVKEADYFVKTIKGFEKKAILVLDWEGSVMPKGPSYAKAFLDRVHAKTGVRPMIYMSRYPTVEYNWSKVAPYYRLWVAEYATPAAKSYTQNPWARNNIGYGAWKQPTMFQYTSQGRISGYTGDLDLDLFYGNRALWDTIAKKG